MVAEPEEKPKNDVGSARLGRLCGGSISVTLRDGTDSPPATPRQPGEHVVMGGLGFGCGVRFVSVDIVVQGAHHHAGIDRRAQVERVAAQAGGVGDGELAAAPAQIAQGEGQARLGAAARHRQHQLVDRDDAVSRRHASSRGGGRARMGGVGGQAGQDMIGLVIGQAQQIVGALEAVGYGAQRQARPLRHRAMGDRADAAHRQQVRGRAADLPDLKPEYTWGLDASLEYYLPGGGIASISAFHRWVDNVLYQNQQAVGTDLYDSDGVDRSAYLLTSTFNGTSGKLYGVEFNYQQQFSFLPSPLDGFGFQGNLALLDGDFDTPTQKNIPFQGLSDTVLNTSLYYEKYGLSARVSYQWRSDWLDTLGGLGSGEYRNGYDNLDVSVRYAVNDNLTLFADATNLTDAIYMAYQGDESMPTEVEQVGRRYMFGVRFGF